MTESVRIPWEHTWPGVSEQKTPPAMPKIEVVKMPDTEPPQSSNSRKRTAQVVVGGTALTTILAAAIPAIVSSLKVDPKEIAAVAAPIAVSASNEASERTVKALEPKLDAIIERLDKQEVRFDKLNETVTQVRIDAAASGADSRNRSWRAREATERARRAMEE